MKKYTKEEAELINEFNKTYHNQINVCHYDGEQYPHIEGFEYTGEPADSGWKIRVIAPPRPQWKVGDWVFVKGYGISEITVEYRKNASWFFKPLNSVKEILEVATAFRPLTDEDWIGKIGDVKVRAYADSDGYIRVFYSLGWFNMFGGDSVKAARTICSTFNIPIMPPELHRGVYKRPGE